MSELFCITYDKMHTADNVLTELKKLEVEHLIDKPGSLRKRGFLAPRSEDETAIRSRTHPWRYALTELTISERTL